jgi:hypothetical protein
MEKLKSLIKIGKTFLALLMVVVDVFKNALKYLISTKGKQIKSDISLFIKKSTLPEKLFVLFSMITIAFFAVGRSYIGIPVVLISVVIISRASKNLPETATQNQKKAAEIFKNQPAVLAVTSLFALSTLIVPSSGSSAISGTYQTAGRSQWMTPPVLVISGSQYVIKGSLSEAETYSEVGHGTITAEPPNKDGDMELHVEGFDSMGNRIESSGFAAVSKQFKTITINVRAWSVNFEKPL